MHKPLIVGTPPVHGRFARARKGVGSFFKSANPCQGDQGAGRHGPHSLFLLAVCLSAVVREFRRGA